LKTNHLATLVGWLVCSAINKDAGTEKMATFVCGEKNTHSNGCFSRVKKLEEKNGFN
jgi:hypothetical protein